MNKDKNKGQRKKLGRKKNKDKEKKSNEEKKSHKQRSKLSKDEVTSSSAMAEMEKANEYSSTSAINVGDLVCLKSFGSKDLFVVANAKSDMEKWELLGFHGEKNLHKKNDITFVFSWLLDGPNAAKKALKDHHLRKLGSEQRNFLSEKIKSLQLEKGIS